jgi:hypothetical protein
VKRLLPSLIRRNATDGDIRGGTVAALTLDCSSGAQEKEPNLTPIADKTINSICDFITYYYRINLVYR